MAGEPKYQKRVIGDATLYCGDSRELLRAGVFRDISAIVSDPPYGIGYQHSGMARIHEGYYIESSTQAVIGDEEEFDPSLWIEVAPCTRTERRINAGFKSHKKMGIRKTM